MTGGFLVLAARGVNDRGGPATEMAGLLHAAGWARVFEADQLEAWTHGPRPPAVRWREDAKALVIGVTHPAIGESGDAEAAAWPEAAAGRAARLCRQVWGSYVALFRAAGSEPFSAFRDPSGTLDAATWTCGPFDVLASGLRCVPPKLQPPRLALDWDAIADFVRRPAALAGRSGLAGLALVAPGELRTLGDGGPARAIWRPADWIGRTEPTAERCRARLSEAVRGTVVAMAAPYGSILAEASGGLDSSIVGAALAAGGGAGKVAAALHYVGDRADSDERAWAARLCERWSLPLTCAPREVGAIDPLNDYTPWVEDLRPPMSGLDAWRDRDAALRLRACGADALLTGMGGDATLFQMPTARILSDLWRARGVGGLADPAWRDAPRWLRRSAWSTWAEALRALRRPRPAPPSPFAGPRARTPATSAAHPWLEGLEAAPPGKTLQIEALAALQITLGPNRRAEAGDVLHPLLAQPVLEACLAIPTWVLARGGRDRGLAREAFADILPPEIVARRSKGSLTSLFSRRVAASLDVLRPFLLDGVLANAGVLDRAAMEVALDADRLIWRSDGLALVRAVAIEAWVRHWQTRVPDLAGASRDRR